MENGKIVIAVYLAEYTMVTPDQLYAIIKPEIEQEVKVVHQTTPKKAELIPGGISEIIALEYRVEPTYRVWSTTSMPKTKSGEDIAAFICAKYEEFTATLA